MKKILLKNARVVSGDGIDEKDVVLSDGKVLKVCESGEGEDLLANIVDEKSEVTKVADREEGSGEQSFGASVGVGGEWEGDESIIIDCSAEGLYVLPGLIDVHVHFREPGLTKKGDFESESSAALAGGVTTVFDMPNTVPPTTSYEALKRKVELAKKKCKCGFRLFMGVSVAAGAGNLDEIRRVVSDKNLRPFLAGVKVYMGDSTGELGVGVGFLEELLSVADLVDVPVVVHAEDQACLDRFSGKFDAGRPASHSEARPIECSVEAVKRVCHLAKKYNRPIHIAHVTSREELDVIGKFRDEGASGRRLVTCEVSPHHLFFNDEMYEKLGNLLKVNPPVRSVDEVRGLWDAVYLGLVDMIATDHSPHTLSEKESGTPPSGMPEVQTALPLLLNEVGDGKLSLSDIVRLCCEKPAEIFGLSDRGFVRDGVRADLVIVDIGQSREVRASDLKYKCGWSCYEGRVLKGVVKKVILGGECG